MSAALPNEGDLIRYKRKGATDWTAAIVKVVWGYDDEPVLTMDDGARLIPSFGDQWEPQP